MRFQKRIKIFPGLTINLSKSGVSTSIGPKGATVNLKRGRSKLTVGLPGTGLSHTEMLSSAAPEAVDQPPPGKRSSRLVWVAVAVLLVAWLVLR